MPDPTLEVRVKVCGIRRLEDGLLAIAEGAWALGFIFHPPSPRAITPAAAAALLARLRRESGRAFLAVGVFVDLALGELQAIVEKVGLDVAQLHGDESPEYASRVHAWEVWKALRVGESFDLTSLDPYRAVPRLLLDTHRDGVAGGTGEVFDWQFARSAATQREIILAGGLRPANVAEAVRSVQPGAIDVSSGVEERPGVKDAEKLRALFREVRGVARVAF